MTLRTLQPSFAGGEISPSMYGRVDNAKYAVGLKTCLNFMIHPHGGASNRPGFRFIGEVRDSSRKTVLIPFAFNTTQTYVLEFGHLVMRVIKDGGYVADSGTGQPYEISTPYTEDQVAAIGYTQSADVLYLCHPSHAPRTLSRLDHDDWTLAAITFSPSIPAPTGGSATHDPAASTKTETITYRVTAISEDGVEESLPSASISVTGPVPYDWVSGDLVTVTWTAVSGASIYRVYKADNGIFGFIGEASGTSFEDNNITPDLADTPPEARNPFNGAGSYPSTAEFFEQRLVFLATDDRPQTAWTSRIGAYNNFGASRPTKDDDAITITLAARSVNRILHAVPLGTLILLTTGGEWRLGGGGGDEPLTPSSATIKPQGFRGSADVKPVVVGNEVIHVQAKGSALRSLSYSLEVDGYVGQNLSVLSEHLFEGRSVVQMAYQQHPDSVIWVVRDDGVILSFTYMREHEVYAWSRHVTDGAFESVTVISEGNEDAVYAVVRRTIGESTKRYVERLNSRHFTSVEDAFFVDSGLTYDGSPATTFSGLGHLEGKDVAIMADGNVLPRQTVESGAVTLPRAYSKVHIGLPYNADLETLDMDLGMLRGLGTVQGRKKSVPKITLRVKDSRNFKAGPTFDRLTATKMGVTTWDAAPPLVTEDMDLTIFPQWNSHGRICIRQDDPVPLTILAAMPEVVIGS